MSDGTIRPGKQFDQRNNISISFTEEMCDNATVATKLSDPFTEIIPHDKASSIVRAFDGGAIQTEFESIIFVSPGVTKFSVPDVLTAIAVLFNKNFGDGLSIYSSSGESAGSYASISLSQKASAQGSASIMPELYYTIQEYRCDKVPTTTYTFYAPATLTQAQLITRLKVLTGRTDVDSWPAFRPETTTIAITGQQSDVSVSVEANQSVGVSATDISVTIGFGDSISYSKGITNRSVTIPPTLHAAETISSTDTATTVAEASITGTSGTNWTAQSPDQLSPTETVTGTVNPSTLTATNFTTIPISGLKISDVTAEPYEWGVQRVRVELVDFIYFA